MIAQKTVFVVGAGASQPYGFPTSQKLLRDALAQGESGIVNHVGGAAPAMDSKKFYRALSGAYLNESIDELLESRNDIQATGKKYMARVLLNHEASSVGKYFDGDWLRFLFARMKEGVHLLSDFARSNPVTFVTYNYDRLIEHRLSEGLATQFLGTDSRAACDAEASKIRVLHLHGSLGSAMAGPTSVPFGHQVVSSDEFQREQQELMFLRAAESIRIVHEVKEDDTFVAARQVLAAAERVFFLGFAFGRTNVDRLDFSNIKKDAYIHFTCKGMTAAEADMYVRAPLDKAKCGNREDPNLEWDCLSLLRERLSGLIKRYAG